MELSWGGLTLSFGIDPDAVRLRQAYDFRAITPTTEQVDAEEKEADAINVEKTHEDIMAHLIAEDPMAYEQMVLKEANDHGLQRNEGLADAPNEHQ